MKGHNLREVHPYKRTCGKETTNIYGWEKTLDKLDKKVTRFIWKGTMSKVARATLLLSKEKGGLGLWSLKAKNNAFQSSWIPKLNLGKLNPYLESTLQMATTFYAEAANTNVPL